MPDSHFKRITMIKRWQALGKDYLSTHISSVAKSTPFSAKSCSTCCHLFSFDTLFSHPKFRKQRVLQKWEVREDCWLLWRSLLLLYLVPAKAQNADKTSRMEIKVEKLLVKKIWDQGMDTQSLLMKGIDMIFSLTFFLVQNPEVFILCFKKGEISSWIHGWSGMRVVFGWFLIKLSTLCLDTQKHHSFLMKFGKWCLLSKRLCSLTDRSIVFRFQCMLRNDPDRFCRTKLHFSNGFS